MSLSHKVCYIEPTNVKWSEICLLSRQKSMDMKMNECLYIWKSMSVYTYENQWVFIHMKINECLCIWKSMSVYTYENQWVFMHMKIDECLYIW